ncbi:hypothetical protein BXO554_03390, partial [Xanthomonas oryzae pv. oryzae]
MLRGMSGSPARVLVVEDEAAIADTVLYALRSEDYAPDTADSRAVSRVKCNTSRDLLLEPVHDLLSSSARNARWMNCKLVLSLRSQFFHSLRFFSSQAKLRST